MSEKKNQKVTHFAYVVREGKDEDQSFWTKVGALIPHGDGKGFNLFLDALPTNGRLTIRERKDED